ncbi:MAG: Rid family hydrolase, partial [Pseudomonadales bacterium]
MSNRVIVNTDQAPAAIGPYSQAVRVDNTVYLSGQIPLIPETMLLCDGGIAEQATQVF